MKTKKLLSAVLAAALVVSSLPAAVFADGGNLTLGGRDFSPVERSRISTSLVEGVTDNVSDGAVAYSVSLPENPTDWDQNSGAGSVDTYTYVGLYVDIPEGAVSLKMNDEGNVDSMTDVDGAFLQGGKFQQWFPVADKQADGSYSLFYGGRQYTVIMEWFDSDGRLISREYVKVTRDLAEPAAKVGTNTYATLAEAMANVADGGTVTLLKDTRIDAMVTVDKSMTLDLGGKTLTVGTGAAGVGILVDPASDAAINVAVKNGVILDARGKDQKALNSDTIRVVDNANLTLENVDIQVYAPNSKDAPYYNGAVRLTTSDPAKAGSVTMNNGAKITELANGGETYGVVGVAVIGPYAKGDDVPEGYVGPKFVMNDGASIKTTGFALCGNGMAHGTTMEINGGVLNSTGSTAIYHPQYGSLTVKGGTITGGETGIEIRSGRLLVTGGVIEGLATPSATTPNGNGTTSSGAGIAIAQHTTKLDIDVAVKGGTIKGYSAVYESNPQNNDSASLDKVAISLEGGYYYATNGGKVAVYSQDKTGFVKSGVYSTDIEDKLVKAGSDMAKDGAGYYYVGDMVEIKIAALKAGDTLEILSISDEDIKVPEGAAITNNTGKDLKVNGNTVKDGEKYTVPAAKPTTPAPSYDWHSVLAGINALGGKGSIRVDVGSELSVPHFIWQAIYGKNITVTFVRGQDSFVVNGRTLGANFDPDTGHMLTEFSATRTNPNTGVKL